MHEPWPCETSQTGLVLGEVTADQSLNLLSMMDVAGVIFNNGIESDDLDFNSGAQATIRPTAKKERLVV